MSNVSPALVKFAEPSEGHFWGIPHLPEERIMSLLREFGGCLSCQM